MTLVFLGDRATSRLKLQFFDVTVVVQVVVSRRWTVIKTVVYSKGKVIGLIRLVAGTA